MTAMRGRECAPKCLATHAENLPRNHPVIDGSDAEENTANAPGTDEAFPRTRKPESYI
jgi:hypothetical protein